jgi:hypothetical protein
MNKTILVAAGVVALACGNAYAASCPAFAPPQIKFEALPSPVERDVSKSAKEIAAARGQEQPLPSTYEGVVAGSMSRAVQMQPLPDGTICGALQVITIKLGYKRKILLAKEVAANTCVAETVADYQTPGLKADEETLAKFGASIPTTYAAEINAIGTATGKTQDDVQQPIKDKASTLFNNTIIPAFEKQAAAERAKIDLSAWKPAPCDGDTQKIFDAIFGKNMDSADNKHNNPTSAQPKAPAIGAGYGGGGGGAH